MAFERTLPAAPKTLCDSYESPSHAPDSGHMQDRTDYRSQYGYVITWYGGPIAWCSKKHQHVGESSAEDEYMAMNHAAKHVVWMRNLLTEMGLDEYVAEPTTLLGDNKQAGKWGREDMVTNGNRFIERQYYKVRDWIRKRITDGGTVPAVLSLFVWVWVMEL